MFTQTPLTVGPCEVEFGKIRFPFQLLLGEELFGQFEKLRQREPPFLIVERFAGECSGEGGGDFSRFAPQTAGGEVVEQGHELGPSVEVRRSDKFLQLPDFGVGQRLKKFVEESIFQNF